MADVYKRQLVQALLVLCHGGHLDVHKVVVEDVYKRQSEKNQIMKSIMDGADKKAGAIVFSLPVTDTAGLRLLDED